MSQPFDWEHQWYPVAVAADLDPGRRALCALTPCMPFFRRIPPSAVTVFRSRAVSRGAEKPGEGGLSWNSASAHRWTVSLVHSSLAHAGHSKL